MERSLKIKLLSDIKAGRVSLESLKEKRLLIRIHRREAGGCQQFINDKPVSNSSFEAELDKHNSPSDLIKIKVTRI